MGSLQASITREMIKKSDMWNRELDEIRKTMEAIPDSAGIPEGITVAHAVLNGVAVETFRHAEGRSERVVLYFHGGGFCLGIYPANRAFVAQLAKDTGLDFILPDYRLAPEHPFPAALEDAIDVYKGLLHSEGYRAEDIAVAGDSSGCALALSALMVLRRSGEPMPERCAFITPVFDLAGTGESFRTKAEKDPFRLEDPLGIAKNYVGDNSATIPELSPLFGSLAGLPRMFIQAAEYDVFLSDAQRMTERVRKMGGQAELRLWKRMWHVFVMQHAFVPESKQALAEFCSFLKA
jgi:acetyl esterase/lipase